MAPTEAGLNPIDVGCASGVGPVGNHHMAISAPSILKESDALAAVRLVAFTYADLIASSRVMGAVPLLYVAQSAARC